MDKYTTTRYNHAPTIGKKRTRFNLSHDILTTCNTGEFVPVLSEFINPGETVDLKSSSLTRLETSLHQTMDNCYFETAYFFCPLRILWTDFEKFQGANDDAWAQTLTFSIPQMYLTGGSGAFSVTPGSLINHLVLPSGNYGSGSANPYLSIEALSLRGVFETWNQWYRDENYDSIIYYSKASLNGTPGSFVPLLNGASFNFFSDNLHVHRLRDRFSTVLPSPQKGQEVSLGLYGTAPLQVVAGTDPFVYTGLVTAGDSLQSNVTNPLATSISQDTVKFAAGGHMSINPGYMEADLSGASSVTINQLRLAIVRQAMLERDARAGTRYFEVIQSRWSTHAPDLVLDRVEYLGGKRVPVNMMEVLQTSETGTTVLGTNAGVSKTVDRAEGFTKSFTQHGILLGFMYFRTDRSYSQGIDRSHFIKDYLDMPDPMLDNIGEVPVYRKELFALKTSNAADVASSNDVFGYQEQYYWLKERINRFSGYFQSGISGTLDSWHYGDDYNDFPLASASWMKEDANQVDRTIAVTTGAENAFQWKVNIHFDLHVTRPFAKYSIPNTFGF